MKKQGVGGSAFFVGVGWLGLPAGAVWVARAFGWGSVVRE